MVYGFRVSRGVYMVSHGVWISRRRRRTPAIGARSAADGDAVQGESGIGLGFNPPGEPGGCRVGGQGQHRPAGWCSGNTLKLSRGFRVTDPRTGDSIPSAALSRGFRV